MGWIRRLRGLPLRTKLVITAVGTAVVVFAIVSSFTFGYWRQESMAAAEQQALLAAASVRSAVEAGLTAGDPGRARRALQELAQLESIVGARVYGTTGVILVSSDRTEEGARPVGVWIPTPRDLPQAGTARVVADGQLVNAFLPLRAGGAAILQVDFSLAPLQAAMDRAARLGLMLLVGSLAAVIFIVATMLEREVVTPIERVAGILEVEGGPGRGRGDLAQLEASVSHLVRKEREASVRAAEQEARLATQAGFAQVGEMAAEMAHEFKRPLASIRSAVSLLEQEYELNDQAQSLLAAVDGQLGKLTETMQDLFALAKPVEMETERVDVPDTVDSALSQLTGLTDMKGRRVERQYDPATPPVYGDRHRIEQAVLNVMLNAMEAMDKGGLVVVSVRPAGDDGVALEFRDTGPGIPESEIEKVILPFYSTKPAGTGLGLPLVARVVAAHRGELDIQSEPGVGTTVRIVLPQRPWGAGEAGEAE
jgi:signal transduction histidine kinase